MLLVRPAATADNGGSWVVESSSLYDVEILTRNHVAEMGCWWRFLQASLGLPLRDGRATDGYMQRAGPNNDDLFA